MMKRVTHLVAAAAVLIAVSALPGTALADGKDYSDGPVINVAAIRTVDGHFDDYMHWLATGYPDIYLVTEYKNWAALDGLGGKFDKLLAETEGSVDNANKSEADRAKIRTVLGSRTEQEAILK